MKLKLLELVQHTETLKTGIQKNLRHSYAWNHIELSRLYRLMPHTPFQKMDETEFAKLLAMTIVILYIQAVAVNRDKIKEPETGWFLATDFIASIAYGIKQEVPLPMEKNLDTFRELLITMPAVTIPPELKACILELGLGYPLEKKQGDIFDCPAMFPLYQEYIHLFEPEMQRQYGIFFTPPAAVSFMVRSIHTILTEKLGKDGGLSHPHICVLDPAAGPGTFFSITLQQVVQECQNHPDVVPISDFINPQTMANYYSIEKILPLWALSLFHLHTLWQGLRGPRDKRSAHVLLGDVFDIYPPKSFTVIMGNPPYGLQPGTTPPWLLAEVQKYGKMTTAATQLPVEKNAKWLLADYVKFIRFAELQICQNGEGVVGFIVNNGFLENPTFRGMRLSLLQSFNEIYILDLHGNSKKPEKDVRGKKTLDENLFPISQGIAMVFFIKQKANPQPCQVYYSSVMGSKHHKKEYLQSHRWDTVHWQAVNPAPDFYLFTPVMISEVQRDGRACYQSYYRITDIFPVHSVSIITGRDRLCIQDSPEKMEATLQHFISLTPEQARYHYQLGEDSRDWSVANAQQDIRIHGYHSGHIMPILYRPFDLRYTYYTGQSRGFQCMPRPDVMRHMLADNLALITVRQVAEGLFNHNFVTDTISEGRVTVSNRGICYHFPLYFYEGKPRSQGPLNRVPNLNEAILEMVTVQMGLTYPPAPTTLFYYIYAVLSSTQYRNKYMQELKMDFPRIPFPLEAEVFEAMAALGEELVKLHLFKAPALLESLFSYQGDPNGVVKKAMYKNMGGSAGRIYINERDYFSHIPAEVWDYQICGYSILSKILTGLKGKQMDPPRVDYFLKVVETVFLTMGCQKKIDGWYSSLETISTPPLVWQQRVYAPPSPWPDTSMVLQPWASLSF